MMLNDQLLIRKVTFKDADCILYWENNEENWAVSENDSKYSIFDIVALIGELQNVQNARQGRWMICVKGNESPIGCVDLTGIDFENNTADVGILIAEKNYRRKGYALMSLQLIEEEAKELGLKKLSCSIHSTNLASIRLFEKCGYQELVGETKEIYFFEKWLKK